MSFKPKKIPQHLLIHPHQWDRPKKRGRWVWWLLGPMFCFGLLALTVNAYAEDREEEIGSGQLVFSDQSITQRRALHLKTLLNVQVSGLLAHVQLHQTFQNTSTTWQEATYIFPLPESAAVNYMQISVGDRVITAEVKEKQKARKIYEKAKTEGKTAALIEQQRPNMFNQKISNIAPGEKVTIELRFIQQVQYADDSFELRFPTTITERYQSPRSKLSMSQNDRDDSSENGPIETDKAGWAFTTAQPIYKANTSLLENPIEINFNLNSGLKLKNISSPYHEIKVRKVKQAHQISLKHKQTPMDRDFVLQWQAVDSNSPQAAIFRESIDGNDYLLAMILPPNIHSPSQTLARDMIFIIDTSGSMKGESIIQAKRSLQRALANLSPIDRFNIIQFNSRHSSLFYDSQKASQRNRAKAIHWVEQLSAGGGTEMLPALRNALHFSESEDHLKQIIFITDGAVSNEAELFKLIYAELNQAKLFTVAIGYAPNTYFMRKAAEFGGGTFTHIAKASEVNSQMNQLFRKLDSPIIRDISITWPGLSDSYPKTFPPLYIGEPLLLMAKTSDASGNITISGKTSTGKWQQTLSLKNTTSQKGLGTLWAKSKIEALQDEKIKGKPEIEVKKAIIDVALRHALISEYTSLVAVEEIVVNTAHLKSNQVPNLSPKGQMKRKLTYPKTATSAELSLWIGLLSLLACAFLMMSKGLRVNE